MKSLKKKFRKSLHEQKQPSKFVLRKPYVSRKNYDDNPYRFLRNITLTFTSTVVRLRKDKEKDKGYRFSAISPKS